MNQFVILSGKGGTGKTSVAAAFAHLASVNGLNGKVVLADADVDAANFELVLEPEIDESHEFMGGKVAVIDQQQCNYCGFCMSFCRFDAIYTDNGGFVVDPIACEGCGACMHQCLSDAIRLEEQNAGQWFRSDSRYGPLFHAALRPAQENSGKLVTMVRQQARLLAMDESYPLVLIDGPPGIGCPVISAVSGADMAMIVAEPTAAGVHDMQRVLETTDHFGVQAIVCINKADIYPEGAAEIASFCKENDIEVIGEVPFDAVVTEAMLQGQSVTAYRPDSPASQALSAIWAKVTALLEEND
jgi:MinD superfamily P-loop ATPase